MTTDGTAIVGGGSMLVGVVRRWWVVAVAVVLAVCVGVGVDALRTPTYSSTATVQAGYSSVDAIVASAGLPSTDPKVQQATQAGVLASDAVRNAVTAHLGHEPDVVVSPVANSQLIAVTASAASAAQAAEDANGYVSTYLGYLTAQAVANLQPLQASLKLQISTLQNELSKIPNPDTSTAADGVRDQLTRNTELLTSVTAALAVPATGARTASLAQAPETRAGMSVRDFLSLFALIGLVLGLALAAALGRRDDRVRSRAEAEAIVGAPVVADFAEQRERVGAGALIAAMLLKASEQLEINTVLLVEVVEGAGAGDVATETSEALGALRNAAELSHGLDTDNSSRRTVAEVREARHSSMSSRRRVPIANLAFHHPKQQGDFLVVAGGPLHADPRAVVNAVAADAILLVLPPGPYSERDLRRSTAIVSSLGHKVFGLVVGTGTTMPADVRIGPSATDKQHVVEADLPAQRSS